MSSTISYPRKPAIRHSLRFVARGLFPLLAKRHITGLENFPKHGPLIVVGNHTGAMEVVMMGIYSSQPLEFLGGVDLPHEPFVKFFARLYGLIPVFRGNASPSSMKAGVRVLRQEGMLGLFPEGGLWEPAIRQARTGVAWISHHAQAPILPIGFGNTRGKLSAMFRFERPEFIMNVGQVLPPVQLPKGKARREALQVAADDIMDAVWALVPQEEQDKEKAKLNETFEFITEVYAAQGVPVEIPADLQVSDGKWLSRMIHRMNLINTLRDRLELPVQPLKELHLQPSFSEILAACESILNYVEQDNPYFFTYRYGPDDGQRMFNAVRQFRDLVLWAQAQGLDLFALPHHHYTDPHTNQAVTISKPNITDKW